jgi:adenine-specific DNA-methyltransferase
MIPTLPVHCRRAPGGVGIPPNLGPLWTKLARGRVKVNGVEIFKPQTGEVVSDGADGIACRFIDTDCNEESFFVHHAYFLGANDP